MHRGEERAVVRHMHTDKKQHLWKLSVISCLCPEMDYHSSDDPVLRQLYCCFRSECNQTDSVHGQSKLLLLFAPIILSFSTLSSRDNVSFLFAHYLIHTHVLHQWNIGNTVTFSHAKVFQNKKHWTSYNSLSLHCWSVANAASMHAATLNGNESLTILLKAAFEKLWHGESKVITFSFFFSPQQVIMQMPVLIHCSTSAEWAAESGALYIRE